MKRLDLSVRYDDKEAAKKEGTQWDPDKKIWFIPPGTNVVPFIDNDWLSEAVLSGA